MRIRHALLSRASNGVDAQVPRRGCACRARPQKRQHDLSQRFLIDEEFANIFLERKAPLPAGISSPKGFMNPRIWFELGRYSDQPGACCHQRRASMLSDL